MLEILEPEAVIWGLGRRGSVFGSGRPLPAGGIVGSGRAPIEQEWT